MRKIEGTGGDRMEEEDVEEAVTTERQGGEGRVTADRVDKHRRR